MTRLLMTTDSVGGIWSYAIDLAGALAPLGVTTTLAVLGGAPADEQYAAAMFVPGLSIVLLGGTLDWLAGDTDAIAASASAVASLAHTSRADLVHLNSPALAALATWSVPVVGACHSCTTTWWDAVRGGPLPVDFQWRLEALGRGYAACDALIAPSVAFAAATERRHGYRPRVVPNGAQAPSTLARKTRRGVLTAGRLWDEAKDTATLDRAACILDAPLWAAGRTTGPHGHQVVLRHVHPLGQLAQSALLEHMRCTPVFVSLARYEPFGLTVLEAAHCGCALVLSDIDSFRELWDGVAVFVRPRDPAAAAAAMQALLDDPVRAVERGVAAADRASRYSTRRMGEATASIYNSLLRATVAA